MESNIMQIQKTEIHSGEHKKVKIRVGHLPSGTDINIFADVFRSSQSGPTVLLVAGVHGDEINGVEILRRGMESGLFSNLKKGNAIIVPLLNVFGFINFSREVPDGKDVNRSFPGNNTGSLASRVARKLTKYILPLVDCGVDFHTGSDARYNYPQIRYTRNHEASSTLADAFSAPYKIAKPLIPKSLRKAFHSQEKPIIIYEGGESRRLDDYAIDQGTMGIENLFIHLGMIHGNISKNDSISINKTSWQRAPMAGILHNYVSSGKKIVRNQPLGIVKSILGRKSKTILANRDGHIISHNRAPVVHAGDAIYNIGF